MYRSNLRKRRGRRANSTPADSHENNIKEEEHSPVRAASPPPAAVPEVKIKQEDEIKQEPLEDVEEIKVKILPYLNFSCCKLFVLGKS